MSQAMTYWNRLEEFDWAIALKHLQDGAAFGKVDGNGRDGNGD